MKVRPFFCYYGGKFRSALRYPAPLYPHIVEPFAGAAGYSMRYATHQVTLCDVDEVVIGVWRYLQRATPEEIVALPDVPDGGMVTDLGVSDEARALIGWWLNKGCERPRQRPSAWMRSGVRPGSFWGPRVRQSIARQLPLIRHWQVFHCDYHDCPTTGLATWFLDPPYQTAGYAYRHGSKGFDFAELGRWARDRKGQVIVCEAEGADWLPFEPLADVKGLRGKSREMIWTPNQGGRRLMELIEADASSPAPADAT